MSLCHPCPWKRPPTRSPGVHTMKRKQCTAWSQGLARWLRIHEPMKLGQKPWRQRHDRHLGKVLCMECP